MDHVIRLIVKGEDLATQVSDKVSRKVVRDQKNIRESSRQTRTELDLLTNSIVQFGDAYYSRAVTPKGMAKAAGVPLKEMPEETARQILVARRYEKGDLKGADRATLAKAIGIPEEDVPRYIDDLKRVLDLYQKINEEAVGTKAKSPLALRTKTLLGVPLDDEIKALKKTRKAAAETTETIKGLNTQISETVTHLQKVEKNFGVLRGLGEAAREKVRISGEKAMRDERQARFDADTQARRSILSPISERVSPEEVETFRKTWRMGAVGMLPPESHQTRLLKQLVVSQDREAAYAENTAKKTDQLIQHLSSGAFADTVRLSSLRQRAYQMRREFLEEKRPFVVGQDKWELENIIRRKALPRGWDRAIGYSRTEIGGPWQPFYDPRGMGFDRGGVRGPFAVGTAGEVTPTGKVKAALDSLDEFFRGNRIKKALDTLDLLTSETRKRTALESYLNDQLAETYRGMGRLHRTIGQLTKGFFSLSTWQERDRRQRELDFLLSKRKNAIEYRELVRREEDLHIQERDKTGRLTGRLRAPIDEGEWDVLGEKNALILQATRTVRHWTREAKVAEKDVKSFGNAFWVAGAKVRNFVNSANQLVNARWLFIITLWTTFVTVLIQLGVALVEVGSSAVKAGAALGGAFTAGVLQALSVVGLLRAALSRITAVFDLAAQQDKLRIRSSTDAANQAKVEADAQDNLSQAIESQKESVVSLAQARKDAKRALVDSAMAERDAALSLQEAELGVIQAKERLLDIERQQTQDAGSLDYLKGQVEEAQRRLALAQQQGQEAEISAASQQLTIAQQNLNAFLDQADTKVTQLKDAQLGVDRAILNYQQAKITAKRASQDNAEAQKKGVEGSDQVVAALKAVRDATKGVADAQQSLADAYAARTAAQQALQDQLADFTAAERSLFNTVVKLREDFRTVFRPITDIIVRSFDDGLQKAAVLLRDPGIINAARGLSTQIGMSIGKISEFVVSKESRDAITFFTREANRNLPIVVDALLNIAKAFTRIGIASAPILRDLLVRFEGLTERFEKWSKNTKNLENFLGSASKHLDTWIELGKVIIRLVYFIGGVAAPEGKTFLDKVIGDLNAWIDKLEANRATVEKFFKDARVNLEQFLFIVLRLLRSIFKAFTSPGAEQFVALIAEVLVPALGQAVYFLGILSGLMLRISKIPFAKEIIAFGFAWGIFTRVIPVLRNLDALLVRIMTKLWESKGFRRFGEEVIIGARNMGKSITGGDGPIIAIGNLKNVATTARAAMARLAMAIMPAAANPYVLAGIGIAALTASLWKLNKETGIVDTEIAALRDTIDWFINLDKIIIEFVFDIVGDWGPLEEIKSTIQDIANDSGLTSTVQGVAGFIGKIFGEDLKTEHVQNIKGLGFEVGTAIGQEYRTLGNEINSIQRNLITQVQSLQGQVLQALELPLYEETPAAKEANRIRKQEAARDRQQQVKGAVDNTKVQRNAAKNAAKEVAKAEKAVRNASTADEKREAKQRLANAKQAYNSAKQALNQAIAQEKEIKHDAAVQDRLDYLEELDKQQRQAVQKRVNQAKAEANALFNGLMKAISEKKWGKAQQYINKIVKLMGKNGIFELGKQIADVLVLGIEKGLGQAQGRIQNAAAKSQQQAQLAIKKERRAEKLLGRTKADEDIPGTPGGSLTASQKLNYLLQTGEVDLPLAGAILKSVNAELDMKILRRVFKLLEIKLKPQAMLKKTGLSAEDYLLAFLKNHPDQEKALAAFANAVLQLQIFDKGGQVQGSQGAAVPIIAHAGEWVLNKAQQAKLSAKIGTSTEGTRSFLFGSGKPSGRYFASGGVVPPPTSFGVAPSFGGDPRLDLEPLWEWTPAKTSWEKAVAQANLLAKLGKKIPWNKGWKIVDAAAEFATKFNVMDPVKHLPGILQKVIGGKNSYDVAKTQISDLYNMIMGARAGNHIDQALLSLMFLPGILRTKRAVAQAAKYGEKLGIIGIGSAPAKWRIFGPSHNLSEVEEKKLRKLITESWGTRTAVSSQEMDKALRSDEASRMANFILRYANDYDRVVVALNAKNTPIGVGAYDFGWDSQYDYVPYAAGIGGGGLHVFRRLLGFARERNKGILFDGTEDAAQLYRRFGIPEIATNRFRIEPDDVELLLKDSRALLRRARMKKAALLAGLKSGKIKFNPNDPVISRKEGWEVILEDLDELLDEPWKNRFNQVWRNALEKQRVQGRLISSDDITNKMFFQELASDMAWRDYVRANPEGDLWRMTNDWDFQNKEKIKEKAKFLKTLFSQLGYHFPGRFFQHGGEVEAGTQGAAVPIIAHVGEWVLNKAQQSKLAQKLRMTTKDLSMFLFGSGMNSEQYQTKTAGMKSGESRRYETFQLVNKTDDYGQIVWFIEFDDGAFGQVRAKDAKKIIATGGQWVPQYVRRSGHGFTASYLDFGNLTVPLTAKQRAALRKKGKGGGGLATMARGGEILASFAARGFDSNILNARVQSYADGGVVTASPEGIYNGSTVSKTVNQNFNVRTEGETDWNYVMRLGGIHALG